MRSALFVNSVFRKNLHLKNRLTFEVHLIFLFLFSSLYFWRSELFLQPLNCLERFIGNSNRFRNVAVRESVIDKVIVVARKENPTLNALGNPTLMGDQAVVLRKP